MHPRLPRRRTAVKHVECGGHAAAVFSTSRRAAAWPPHSTSRVIPADRLGPSFADLHRYLVPLGAGLDAVRRIKTEDVLGAELVLDVGVNAIEIGGGLDVIDIAARLRAEASELEARVDLG